MANLVLTILGMTLVGAAPEDDVANGYNEPYCGLYCMHAALSALGKRPDFAEMNQSRYLSGYIGSTAADLVRLAGDQGEPAEFRPDLTLADLRASDRPILLHTDTMVTQANFHHWILFLGLAGDALRVYDPPRGEYAISQAELLSHWDGVGVAVGKSGGWNAAWATQETLLAVCLVLGLGFVFSRIGRPAGLASRVLVTGACAAAAWHLLVGYGFLRNRYSLDTIATAHQSRDFPIVDQDELRRLLSRPDVTVIDARTPEDFRSVHVPGARNIPLTVTMGSFRENLESIPADNQIVVYCTSESCGWADAVARLFPPRGFGRVAVFRSGMAGWLAPEQASRLRESDAGASETTAQQPGGRSDAH